MRQRKRFGEILVDAKVLTQESLAAALEKQRGSGKALGQVLEEMGMVTEKNIAATLARQFGYKTVSNIARASFGKQLLSLVDVDTATRRQIFPLKRDGNTLFLAMVNPLDMEIIDSLTFAKNLRVVPCVTTPSEIQAAINCHYHQLEETSATQDDWWKVLVVDDQDLVRSAALAALKTEGYTLFEAANGADGLKMAMQNKPHVVIADTVMPRMDGYEMFRAIKSNAQIKHVPVIALSSKSTAEEEAHLLDMGYFDFIAKPINPVRLLARIRHALRMVYGEKPPVA